MLDSQDLLEQKISEAVSRRVHCAFGSLILLLTVPVSTARAHCPLCAVGLGAAAGGAMFIGVKSAVIGLFVGGFSVSMGLWLGNSKNLGTQLRMLAALASYLLTILPLTPLVPGNIPVYVSVMGDYGTVLNRTYLLNSFMAGSAAGALLTLITPWLSEKITSVRGRRIQYQGVVLTLSVLSLAGIAVQFLIWEVRF